MLFFDYFVLLVATSSGTAADQPQMSSEAWYASRRDALNMALKSRRPLFVGVFMDQHEDEINKISDEGAFFGKGASHILLKKLNA